MDIFDQLPIVRAIRVQRARRALLPLAPTMGLPVGVGLGGVRATSTDLGAALLGAAIVMGLNGLCGYVVGKVLAPSDAKAKKYGMIGIPVGALTGLLGMAVFAAVASPR